MIPVAFVIPWISYANSEAGIWIYIIVMTFVFYLLNFTVLTSQIVMSNNCVLKHERGKLNGLYMFVGSAARALAPAVMGVVFSATTNSGKPFPVDYTFCFSLLAFCSLLMWFFSRKIPKSVEKAKEAYAFKEIPSNQTESIRSHNKTESIRTRVVITNQRSSIMTEEGYHQFDEDEEEEMEKADEDPGVKVVPEDVNDSESSESVGRLDKS
jgi:Na+/melibiose symporter-like transporter